MKPVDFLSKTHYVEKLDNYHVIIDGEITVNRMPEVFVHDVLKYLIVDILEQKDAYKELVDKADKKYARIETSSTPDSFELVIKALDVDDYKVFSHTGPHPKFVYQSVNSLLMLISSSERANFYVY